jgi:hypothetical protein
MQSQCICLAFPERVIDTILFNNRHSVLLDNIVHPKIKQIEQDEKEKNPELLTFTHA